jgi:hypothetical protein
MPSAGEILQSLASIAESWKTLAMLWHVYAGVLLVLALSRSRAHDRLVGALLIPPLVSVSVLAWIAGNPFNGAAFGALSIVQAALLGRLSRRQVEKAHPARVLLGSALVAFGWAYPHFLPEDPASTYLYAAPLGLIPCPTLSLVLGVTIVLSNLRSRAWSVILACAALFYGALGVLYLGVTIDWVLVGGGIGLLVLSVRKTGDGVVHVV